jgi:hypothetical protein
LVGGDQYTYGQPGANQLFVAQVYSVLGK